MASLKMLLEEKLSKEELALVPRAFDQVGSIAIFSEFPKELKKKQKIIAQALMQTNPYITTVAKKMSDHAGKFRTKKVSIIAGKKTKVTEHRESGVRVLLDVEKCYFSPRLSSERLRIAQLVKKDERVLVLFSGIGIYPLIIAKNSQPKEVVGVEHNPIAHAFAVKNIALNKVKNVTFIKKDAAKFVPDEKFDRIVMMLPGGAEKFLKHLPTMAKKNATIHFYDFQHEGEFKLAEQEVKKVFPKAKILNIVKAGMYSPRKWRICVDFKI